MSNMNLNNRSKSNKEMKNIHFWLNILSKESHIRRKSRSFYDLFFFLGGIYDLIIIKLYLVFFFEQYWKVFSAQSLLSPVLSGVVVSCLGLFGLPVYTFEVAILLEESLRLSFMFKQVRMTKLKEKLAAANTPWDLACKWRSS